MGPLVTQVDDIAWGATVIAGTRMPVDTLFDYLERGKTLDEYLEQPTVRREQAVAIPESAKQGMLTQAACEAGHSTRSTSHSSNCFRRSGLPPDDRHRHRIAEPLELEAALLDGVCVGDGG